MYRLVRKPSPALVVACLALAVALGGTGYAAIKLPKNSVGTKQLKKNAVVSSKVKNASLKALDFASGQLPKGEKGEKGDTGATGPHGATGARGASGATNVFVRSQSGSVSPSWSFATAQCLSGERVTGGGVHFANSGSGSIPVLVNSNPDPSTGTPTGWFASVQNMGSGTVQATAYVVCASP